VAAANNSTYAQIGIPSPPDKTKTEGIALCNKKIWELSQIAILRLVPTAEPI